MQQIFVYGTLKRGLYNHSTLADSKFLGEVITKYRYPMINENGYYPYLINEKNSGKYIKGELFAVSNKIFKNLDVLEGYPILYTRDEIELTLDNKSVIAIAYFVNEKIDHTKYELLEEYTE
jgi:gamma-glutamylcyclotransferase (GGCT)/AIG2-like uncharacterized protein YtfP